MFRKSIHIIFILTVVILSGCSLKPYIKEDESLVDKNKVNIIQDNEDEYIEAVRKENINSIVKPKANSKFLGTRLAQYIYLSLAVKQDSLKRLEKENKLNNFFQKQFGQEPIYVDSLIINRSLTNVENYLFNNGYFNGKAEYSITPKDSISSIINYTVNPKKQHYFGKSSIKFLDSTLQSEILNDIKIEDYITKGDPFSVSAYTEIQNELVKNALENGYYDFTKNSIYIDIDTLSQERTVNSIVIVNDEKDSLYNKKYYIRDVYLKLGKGVSDNYPEPVAYNKKQYSQSEKFRIKPKVLDRFIQIEKGDQYSRSNHLSTINKLYDLPIIKYANIDFNKVPLDTTAFNISDSLFLDVFIDANTTSKYSYRFEPTISEFEGPAIGAEIGFQNKNVFNGGELFDFSISGNLQSVNNSEDQNELFGTQVLQVSPSLTFPRLLLIENVFNNTYEKTNNQSTKLAVNYGYQNYVELFNLKTFGFQQLWEFQTSPHNKHTLSLFDISRTRTDFQPEYEIFINQYPSLKFSYETRFILGSNYNYSYSNKLKKEEGESYFNFSGTIDLSGNLVGLFSNKEVLTFKLGSDRDTISQYIRPIINFTHHKPFSNNKIDWVNHIGLGGAFTTNNNVPDIPAVKQFFLGGSSSMRAWDTRALGPGIFEDPNIGSDQNVDQRGDLMLELNSELRYPLTTVFGIPLRGALFTDIGNIWSLKENEEIGRDGAEFNRDNFYKEIAVGAGTGLRLDLNFLVIRGDFAWKLRDPSLPEGERWLTNPIGFNKDKMNFQLGIGYPFEY